jgi:signal peptidase II
MKSKKKAALLSIGIIVFVLVIDQILKIWIKTHLFLGEEIPVIDNWFLLHFVENEGMAFGFSFGGDSGKIILSLLRLVAVIAIGYYLYILIEKRSEPLKIIVFSLILAGALGNIIDSCFYGLVFTESTYYQISSFTLNHGYAPFLHGKVVDMLYFPLIDSHWPEWMPFIGGKEFQFFRPVFNIADSSITIGVLLLLIFYKKLFGTSNPKAISNK